MKGNLEEMKEGNLKGYAPLIFHVTVECYNKLVNERKAETILEEVADMYATYGFEVKAKGIGWTITI